MKHILAGTAEQIGGMPSESSKVVMGINENIGIAPNIATVFHLGQFIYITLF